MDWRCYLTKAVASAPKAKGAVVVAKPAVPAVKKAVVAKAAPSAASIAKATYLKAAIVTCAVTGAAVVAPPILPTTPVVHQHELREEPAPWVGQPGAPFHWGRLGPIHRGGTAGVDDPATGDVLASVVAGQQNAGEAGTGAPVPEPGTIFLVGTGLIGTAIWYRGRK